MMSPSADSAGRAERVTEALAADPEWQRQVLETYEKLAMGEIEITTAEDLRRLLGLPSNGSEGAP